MELLEGLLEPKKHLDGSHGLPEGVLGDPWRGRGAEKSHRPRWSHTCGTLESHLRTLEGGDWKFLGVLGEDYRRGITPSHA